MKIILNHLSALSALIRLQLASYALAVEVFNALDGEEILSGASESRNRLSRPRLWMGAKRSSTVSSFMEAICSPVRTRRVSTARVPGSFFGGFGMIASEDFGAMGCCGKWI